MTITKKLLGITKDGVEVYDRIDVESHLHVSADVVAKMISMVELGNNFKFGRFPLMNDEVWGTDRCVARAAGDKVVMYKRPGRNGYTPMVLNRQPEETRKGLLVLCFDNETLYNGKPFNEVCVVTAYTGEQGPQEPWDPHCKDVGAARKYWAEHALVPTMEELMDMKMKEVC